MKVTLRPPSQVMQLARMGAFHQTRLSFMRALLRDLSRDNWQFTRPHWNINKQGAGEAVYELTNGARKYSLAACAHCLPPEKRSDRVIAEAWDSTFTLCDGALTPQTIRTMRGEVSKQEAGRQSDKQLVLSRANRSVRLFEHVADSLARGKQPQASRLDEVGYLMRTTAVYANGKFGVAPRESIMRRAEMRAPFRAEMLAVWMFRAFTIDIVEHIAKTRAPEQAVTLNKTNRKRLGIGNATGLGMAPFLINHPLLLHKWIHARETALARVRASGKVKARALESFMHAAQNAKAHAAKWRTADKTQESKIAALKKDLARVIRRAQKKEKDNTRFWDLLYRWGESELSLEGQEMLVSLMMEAHAELVDDLAAKMSTPPDPLPRVKGAMSVGKMRALLETKYAWALQTDFSRKSDNARFWYVSADKMEPRLGECDSEAGAQLQLPLVVARDMQSFHGAICEFDSQAPLADFLLAYPQHRHSARRACVAANSAYGEIRANLASSQLLPLDMLRCKLSFFGATRFDPRSDRWLRITMYQNAPHPGEPCGADNWAWAS